MNSVHDVGGMHGFGSVMREEDEPVFHADWEKSTFASANAVPERPDGTEDMNEDDLAQLVTRDSMIGVTKARSPLAA